MNLTKIEIDTGSGFVEFNPIHTAFELSMQRGGNVRVRFVSSGSLHFYGNEFDTLNTLRKSGIISLNIAIYINYLLATQGRINLESKKWDFDKKICELSVDIVDEYTELLKSYDIERNMFGQASVNSAKIRIDSSLHQIALPPYAGNFGNVILVYNPDGTIFPTPGSAAAHDWNIIDVPYSTLTNDSITAITDAGSGKILITSPGHGLIDSQYNLATMTMYGMSVSSYNGIYNTVIVIDNNTFTVTGTWNGPATGDWKVAESGFFVYTFKNQYVTFPADGFTIGEYFDTWYLKTGHTVSDAELEYDAWRIIYDIIEDLLAYSDNSINLTQVAGANDYCKYFDVTDTDYNKLMIDIKSNIKDPSSIKTNAQFTLQRLLEVYKSFFNLDWRINDNNYLQFIHPSENVQSLPSFAVLPKHDFTAQSKALSKNSLQYDIKDFVNSEIWNTEKYTEGFFAGYPIIYDNESAAKKEFSLNEFYNDLRRLTLNDDNISDDGYCIISTYLDSSENIIWNVGENINGKLGISDLQANILNNGDRPFLAGEINNVPKTFTNIKNSKFIELSQPLNSFDDLDFDYLCKLEITDSENVTGAQIEIIKQKFDGSFAKIGLSF